MFKKILEIWAEQAFTRELVDEFLTMLENSEKMLSYALKKLSSKSEAKKRGKKVYEKDQKINITEKDIRQRIFFHLSTIPNSNLPAYLELISIVKDAERIGDYVKNLFELKQFQKKSDEDGEIFEKVFSKPSTELTALFGTVSSAFKNSDKDLALQSIQTGYSISTQCEDIIQELVSSDYPPRQAVIIALGARYMKRIAIHLTNIVTSVTNPFPELDFFNKKAAEVLGEDVTQDSDKK